jgi:3',5'-cyclic AMP phosphodiesterase CpdA
MAATSFVHVSDLHIGIHPAADRAAAKLSETLLHRHLGPVLVTGDVTHRGRRDEFLRFQKLFAPLAEEGRLLIVPGNHDRLGDDLRDELMPGPRVQATRAGDLWVVRLDSTGDHNRRWLESHGIVTDADIAAVVEALRAAPPDTQTVLLLHHHPMPLVHDHPMERLVTMLGWPNARELATGRLLLESIRGLCDAVLHGHRHLPAELLPWPADQCHAPARSGGPQQSGGVQRPLRIFSAGSSTLQRTFRAFRSATTPACWVMLDEPSTNGEAAEVHGLAADAAGG